MSALATEQDWLLSACGGSVREFFAELGLALPNRTGMEAPVRCFANVGAHSRDDRTPSCSVNLLTGLWHCHGCGERGNAYVAALAFGLTEPRARELARRHGLFLEKASEKGPRMPSETKLKSWRRDLLDRPELLDRLRRLRGWNPRSVVRLGVGWDGERLTLPVRNQRHKIVGLVRYLPGGEPKSLALPGSKRELFPAPELFGREHPLFVVEGEPDAIAVHSAGHRAVAVPGAGAWKREWAQRLLGRRVVVLPDCDAQGRALAARVACDVPGSRVIDLEPGRADGWDVGDLVREASTEGGLWQVSRLLSRIAEEHEQ